MHASCSICGDIFTGIDPEVIHSTPCGHIFHYVCLLEWLRRKPNCPHCRAIVDAKNTIKLYFQLNSHLPEQDSTTLSFEVQNLQFQLKMKDLDLNKAKEEAIEAKSQAKGLRSLLVNKENEVRNHEQVVCDFQEKIKVLKSQLRGLSELQLRAEELEKQVKQYEGLEAILKGSSSDAAEALALMKDVSDPNILCTCISTLKKELNQHKMKYKQSQFDLNSREQKLTAAKRDIANLEQKISILTRSLNKLKEDLSHTEKDNENLKKKCKHLEEAIMPSGSASNTSNPRDKALKRLINEYPVPSLKKNSTGPIEFDITPVSDTSTKVTETGISPISPIRLYGEGKKRTMLNKNRLTFNPTSVPRVQCFDGLGGHVVEGVTRTDRTELLSITKNKTNKLLPSAAKRLKSCTSTVKQQSSLLGYIKKT